MQIQLADLKVTQRKLRNPALVFELMSYLAENSGNYSSFYKGICVAYGENEELVILNGHHRATALYLYGIKEIRMDYFSIWHWDRNRNGKMSLRTLKNTVKSIANGFRYMSQVNQQTK